MNGDETNGTEVSIEKLAAFSSDGHSAAKHRLRGSCAHTHDKLWPNNFELCLQPGPAGYHLAYERFLVHTSLATLYPLEVLDCIGYVNLLTGIRASAKALSSRRPAGPTNGWPCRSS